MSRTRTLGIALALSAAATPALAGGPLVSPLLFANGGSRVECVATNAGTKPTEVTIVGRGLDGAAVVPSVTTCVVPPATLPIGATCFTEFNVNDDVSCSITVSGKVRGAGMILDGSGIIVTTIPATAK